MLHHLSELKDKIIIFMDGESHDHTKEGSASKFCLDFTAPNCKTSDDMLQINYEIAKERNWNSKTINFLKNEVVYFQVSPYLFAFYKIDFKQEKPVLRFLFKEAMDSASDSMSSKGKEPFGTLEKRLDDNREMEGNFSFSTMLYLPDSAKRNLVFDIDLISKLQIFLPDDIKRQAAKFNLRRLIEDEHQPAEKREYIDEAEKVKTIVEPYRDRAINQSTLINRKIQAAAIETILEKVRPKNIPIFAKKTGYVGYRDYEENKGTGILHFIRGNYNFRHLDALRNIDRNPLGINDPSAMRILKGELEWYL
jgi:hypothetical protein